ncbi:MAG: SDR family oxidoreductase [Anaerolineae bacterium]|nr:SDR family oxidoreductase [Anaerolineae bacterium]
MPHTLAGQTALITGGGRGIGRAVAHDLAAYGATVVLAARSAHEVNAAAEDLRLRGATAWGLVCDVANPEDVRALVERVVEECGTVDILINNAGILSPMGMTWDVDPEEWAYNIHVNLVGVFRMTHAVLPLMIEEGGGRIINVSTGAARSVTPGWSAYGAAKAGLDHFTRILAAEVHPHGVRVNAVYPGATDTQMQADIRRTSDEQFPAAQTFRRRHAEGQLRDPREPAELIVWLCTSHARDLSGQILDINDPAVRERVAHDLGRPRLPDPSR